MFSAKKQVKTKKKVLKKGFCCIFLQLTASARRHQSTNQRKNLSWAILKPLAGHFWPAGRGLDVLVLSHLQSRLHEHNPATSPKSNQQSDVTKHLLENPNHIIDFNDPEVLRSACNTKELLIKET